MSSNPHRATNADSEPGVVPRAGLSMLPLIVSIWVTLVGIGFVALLAYHNMPGERKDFATIWPSNNSIRLDTQRANLVVFIHPECPCSVATLNELTRIQTSCGARVNTHVVFYSPLDMPWKDTNKVRQALAIPNVHITNDPTGQLAERYGALTSGHALLYSSSGHRIFSGGITPARGHEGENLGRNAIVRYVLHGETICDKTNVYGCPILDAPEKVAVRSGGSEHGAE